MDYDMLPLGFGMALAMNELAMNVYAAMSEEEKRKNLNQAHNARSKQKMHRIVDSLANGSMENKRPV